MLRITMQTSNLLSGRLKMISDTERMVIIGLLMLGFILVVLLSPNKDDFYDDD